MAMFVLVISPGLMKYLIQKGYSTLPKDAIDYISDLVNEVLKRRRNKSERRNDFIQIMVDHEEDTGKEQNAISSTNENKQQGTAIKKSNAAHSLLSIASR
jgi:hypothetical protein